MYTNFLLFLVAIFLFSVDSVPETPLLPAWQSLAMLVAALFVFSRVARKRFQGVKPSLVSGYFRVEKQLSIAALCLYAAVLYICDIKYYLSVFSFAGLVPAGVNVAGVIFFLVILSVMWRQGRGKYEHLFGKKISEISFILTNIKNNLPIILPWVVLSLLYDLISLLPFSGLRPFLDSRWGDLVFFSGFLLLVIVFFPPLVRRLWGCKKLTDGVLKDSLDRICRRHNFKADYYLWPLFEGRMLTAGVMGIVPGLRYILLTPALIESMSMAELEAVMAHEIGHVKKFHLLLYACLIGGFSVMATLLTEPVLYYLLSLAVTKNAVIVSGLSVEDALSVVSTLIFLVAMVIYFRFIFGYFIRNFERQADLYAMAAMGDNRPLISAFEKIAFLGGIPVKERNWHHFGIGERIDCLRRAEEEPALISRHNRKVLYSLIAYIGVVLFTVVLVRQIPMERLAQRYQENLVEPMVLQRAEREPDNALWQRLAGDILVAKGLEEKGLTAYENALRLEPTNPIIMNNLAWLLLTAKVSHLRDPARALVLARGAATLKSAGNILDTLATAYWANGLVDEAVRIEKRAALVDGGHRRFYQSRIDRFTRRSYGEAVADLEAEQEEEQEEEQGREK